MANDNKDWFYESEEFQNYFKGGSRSLLLRANLPHFTILAVSDAYLALVQKERDEVLGKDLFDVFPGSSSNPSERNSVFSSFQRAIENKKTDVLPVFPYEIYKKDSGKWETEYWTNSNEPIFGDGGEVAYLINTTTNITQKLHVNPALQNTGKLQVSLEREQELNEELASTVEELRAVNEELHDSQGRMFVLNNELEARVESRTREIKNSENRFRSLIEQIPAAINLFLTTDLVIDLPNDKMLELWGRTLGEVAGKPLAVAMPELEGQPFMQKLRDVISTGIAYSSTEEKAFIQRNSMLEECYFDIIYQPIVNEDGSITSCLQIAHEVTEEVVSRRKIQALNEELAAANEELAAINEELAAASEEQIETNKQLAEAIQQSEIQRERLNNFFMQVPAGICVLSGPELVYDLVNPGYQKLLPGRNLLGRPIFEALPELAGTSLQDVLLSVYRTGEPVTFRELLVPLSKYENEPLQDHYFAFTYAPRRDEKGETDGILVFCYEVTEQVNARKKVEQAEESLRIALISAGMGTWSVDLTNDLLTLSDRAKEIHGLEMQQSITLQESFEMIQPEFREVIKSAVTGAKEKNKSFSEEYLINPKNGSPEKWLRSTGVANYNADGKLTAVSGSILDITEQKEDEQRKNDFIGMVSHELKTPLTSLSGYLQMLRVKTGNDDAFTNNMLGKANKQIGKMTTMINGFLNVSRLESGKLQINKQRFDMAVLVKEMEEETFSLYNSHNIIFRPVEETYVDADRDKIGQVISNLISNAVKYSLPHTEINVACVAMNGMALVSIKDEGIGIKDEDKARLFDRYYRVNNGNPTSVSGFGIGLYLCAEIIQRHDGTIWVDSEVGKGSVFSFTLPVEK